MHLTRPDIDWPLVTGYVLYLIGALSITAGAHRLWSHRSYKARLPLRVMLMLFNLTAAEVCMIDVIRNICLTWQTSEKVSMRRLRLVLYPEPTVFCN